MSGLTLGYPVYSLDRKLYLPAGTTLAEKELLGLIASSNPKYRIKYSLMDEGTVRKDILDFLGQPPGNTVFSDERELTGVIELMEHVRLSRPELDSVRYFQEYDPYTYRHILTVLAYSTLLGKDLVANYHARIREMATSPLHDFGKICVPLDILRKSTPLTREERKNLEHHTVAGFILLSYYSQSPDYFAARVARDHHERRNGSGYPRGIHMNDPLVEIVAICDIYDALTSSRPYRPVSFNNRSALEEITMMVERKEVNREVVQALVAHNRREKPHFSQCIVSLDKRGVNPPDNFYGIFAEGE
jgi:HD-GYP domain-containing protein (c-di-GMP phosphodiesterase class II)